MHTTTETSTETTGNSTATGTAGGRFVDPAVLYCPECGDRAIGVAPGFWQVRDGLPVAQFSHPDRTALCRTMAGRVAEPDRAVEEEAARREELARWHEHDQDGGVEDDGMNDDERDRSC